MKNRPFDLAKLDFEKIRKRKRRKLLRWSAPVCVAIMITALYLVYISALKSIAYRSYATSSYEAAVSFLDHSVFVDVLEKYKVYFNQGNAYFKRKEYNQAENYFRKSLEIVPKVQECSVRINLALSIEAQGDREVDLKHYDIATEKYDDIKAVLYDGQESCNVQLNRLLYSDKQAKHEDYSENQRDFYAIYQRIQEKSNDVKRKKNGDETDSHKSNSSEATKKELENMQRKIDELEEKTKKAQKYKSDREEMDRFWHDKTDTQRPSKRW